MPAWEHTIATRLRALRLDSIRHKLIAFALLATLIPSLITGTLSYLGNRRALTDKTTDQLQAASLQSAREVDLWIKERFYDLRVFSSSYEVSENLERLTGPAGGTALRRVTEYLTSVRVRSADFSELLVYDLRGRRVASTSTRPAPLTLPPEALHDVTAGQIFVDRPYWDSALGRPAVVLVVPIERNNAPLGALAARTSLASVERILARFTPGDSASVALVSGTGGVITTGRSVADSALLKPLAATGGEVLFQRLGNPVEFTDRGGEAVVGTLQPVPRLDGAVVAMIPQAEAYGQVNRLRNVTVLTVAGLLAGVGLLAYILAQLIVRPLDRLTAGAAKVAAGDLEVDLPVLGGGEVGYLTEVFNNMVARLRESRKELERLSVTDSLTGLFNRRHLMQVLGPEVQRAERAAAPLSLLMVDVDHFKQFNDTFGHPAGDAVLARVAAILREATRDVDIVARYGGEEFLAVLPATTTAGALEVAGRIRARLANEVFDGGAVTVSVGVSQYPGDGRTPEALIMSADLALYQAKNAGRDRVVTAVPATDRRATDAPGS